MGTDSLYYIMDYSGNYYRTNQADQLVSVVSQQDAMVFTFAQANSRICVGKKAAFYCMIPIEDSEDETDAAECEEVSPDEEMGVNDMEKQENTGVEEYFSPVKELTYDELTEQAEKDVSSYDLSEIDWAEYLTHFTYLVEGLKPYRQKCPFVLYEKYSRRDVSLLMNAGKDLSSTMYGMSQLGDDVFIFVTYHKEENTDEEKQYVDGKPDYADEFVDNVIFRWDSQIDKKLDGAYMNKVLNTPRKHLFVQKTDAENNFFYMGEFDVLDAYEEEKKNNRGLMKPICKLKFRMHTAVREDLLRYLQSGNEMEKEAI